MQGFESFSREGGQKANSWRNPFVFSIGFVTNRAKTLEEYLIVGGD